MLDKALFYRPLKSYIYKNLHLSSKEEMLKQFKFGVARNLHTD